MKVLTKRLEKVVTETYMVEDEIGRKYTYKDYLDNKGKCIDCELRDSDGNSVDNPALLERVQDTIDSHNIKHEGA
jgi:hypothetical protein